MIELRLRWLVYREAFGLAWRMRRGRVPVEDVIAAAAEYGDAEPVIALRIARWLP